MIISDEQIRCSVEYVTAKRALENPTAETAHSAVDVVDQVMRILCDMPEIRTDRVCEGRKLIEHGLPAGAQVADKLVARAISDCLR